MRTPAPVVAIATVVALAVTACAGSPAGDSAKAASTTIPFTMQPPVTAFADSRGILGVDHITLDDTGVYLCVLRRGDDLADLRARYNTADS